MRLLKSARVLLLCFGVILIATGAWAWADNAAYLDATFIPNDHLAIQYNDRPLSDPITLLSKKLESGQAKLTALTEAPGYLPSILKNLTSTPTRR